jgi:hypothetical protein
LQYLPPEVLLNRFHEQVPICLAHYICTIVMTCIMLFNRTFGSAA